MFQCHSRLDWCFVPEIPAPTHFQCLPLLTAILTTLGELHVLARIKLDFSFCNGEIEGAIYTGAELIVHKCIEFK